MKTDTEEGSSADNESEFSSRSSSIDTNEQERIKREEIEEREVTLLRQSCQHLSARVLDQSEAIKNIQIKKYQKEAYDKYADELRDLGIKEANPPLPPPEPVPLKRRNTIFVKRAGFMVVNPFAPKTNANLNLSRSNVNIPEFLAEHASRSTSGRNSV